MKPISLRVVKTLRAFYRLRQEWDSLLNTSPQGTIFLTHEWLGSWWSVFGKGRRLRVLLAYNQEGRLVGGVPFYIRLRWVKRLLPIREMRFVATGESV